MGRVHFIGLTLLFGSIAAWDLRLLGVPQEVPGRRPLVESYKENGSAKLLDNLPHGVLRLSFAEATNVRGQEIVGVLLYIPRLSVGVFNA
jgi:hypothetical protein